jgi:hypothetical protein
VWLSVGVKVLHFHQRQWGLRVFLMYCYVQSDTILKSCWMTTERGRVMVSVCRGVVLSKIPIACWVDQDRREMRETVVDEHRDEGRFVSFVVGKY